MTGTLQDEYQYTFLIIPRSILLGMRNVSSNSCWENQNTHFVLNNFFFRKSYSLWDYYWYSALGPVWAETRVQSGDWYGSGKLHPGQVLRGSLPFLSPPFFRCSHFSPPGASTSATTWEIPAAEVGTVGENVVPVILPKWRLPRPFRDLLRAANLRHGTDGFTSPPKEGVLRIFSFVR